MKKKTKLYLAIAAIITVIAIVVAVVININSKSIDIGNVYDSRGEAGIIETDNIYYFIDETLCLIKVFDKETGVSSVLCNKPECKHNSNTCNGYIAEGDMVAATLSYYDNHIYYVDIIGSFINLIEMSMDGSERKIVTELYEYVQGENMAVRTPYMKVYNGYGYYCFDETDSVEGISKKSLLYKVNLKESDDIEIIGEYEGYNTMSSVMQISDDIVYYQVGYFSEDLSKIYTSIYQYKTEDDKVKILLKNEAGLHSAGIIGDKIYYKKMNDDIYVYTVGTKETEKLIDFTEKNDMLGNLYTDGKYLFYDNTSGMIGNENMDIADVCIKIYDLNGNEISRVPINEGENFGTKRIYKGKDKIIYFIVSDDYKNVIKYIDTSDVKEDKVLEWKYIK